MGSKFFYSIKTHFDFLNNDFLYDHMYKFVSFFCSYCFYLFGLLSRRLFRSEQGKNLYQYDSNSDEVWVNRMCSSCSNDLGTNQSEEQSWVASPATASSSRYEFLSGKGLCRFIEEPRTLSFTVHESLLDSDFSDAITDTPILVTEGNAVKDMPSLETEKTEETEAFFESNMAVNEAVLENEEEPEFIEKIISDEENSVFDDGIIAADMGKEDFETEKTEDSVKILVDEVLVKPEMENSFTEEINDFEHEDGSSYEVQLLPECDSEDESICSNDIFPEQINSIVSNSSGISGIGFIDQIPELETLEENRQMETTDSDDEYIELHPKKHNSTFFEEETSSSIEDSSEEFQEQRSSVDEQVSEKSEESYYLFEEKTCDFEIQKETDYLVEHEDLIQQLKMELKLARTGGLPTILEESESEELLETPKVVQQLKPMKIDDQKLDYKHLLEGIRKVHRNYSDKMRKLDILNFQTMHALGLVEIKSTVELQRARKSAIMSLLSNNLWVCQGSSVTEPMKKVIADMHRDLETVYIGQLCLSWEILHWQYCKAQELQNYESQRFNQVAGEFQLFQVLIQRFQENEQFQGPRIQNYVNNRCVFRSLLQVPLLRDDNSKDKGQRGNESNEDAITSQMIPDIIKQSMKVFWDFVRADKDETNTIFQSPHSNLEQPLDLELLTDVQIDFQKKEKKIKDILRSGNCIVKRFKKQREEDYGMNQTLLIAQVEMKLVAKVLNMSKLTTDKLIWCHEKLDKINVCNRKVFVESSFLLFPS